MNRKDYLEYYKPSIIILQIGIVDCAPRLFTYLERKILKVINKKFSKKYVKIVKKFRERSTSRVFVKPTRFYKNIKEYLSRCDKYNRKKVIYIGILPAGKKFQIKNKKAYKNIIKYNNYLINLTNDYPFMIFHQPFNFINVDKYTINDGYHLNNKGHMKLFNSLKNKIK